MGSQSKGSKSKKSKSGGDSKGKGKGKDKNAEVEPVPFEYVRQPTPPPPPGPPKPSLVANLRRQVYYPYANRPSLTYREPVWSPTYPLCTSWGDIMIAQLPFRRISRYQFDAASNTMRSAGDPIITPGEPRMMIEVPKTGRIAVILYCPTAKNNCIAFYNPETFEIEYKIQFPFKAVDPETIPTTMDPDSGKPLPREFTLEDESSPYGICANMESICITFDPLQKMKFLHSYNYTEQDFKLENYFTDERTCIHLTASGSCVMNDRMLFVAVSRPNRILGIYLSYSYVFDRVDRIRGVLFANFGLDRFSFGEPYCVQLDSLGVLVANDSQVGVFHVYNTNKLPKGPCNPVLPNAAETCYMGSWKVDAYQRARTGYFSLAKNGTAVIIDRHSNSLHLVDDQAMMRWYDDVFTSLENILLRPVVDPLMPELGDPPIPATACRCSTKDSWESIPPEQLLPESWAQKYKRPEKIEIKEGEGDAKSKGKASKEPKKKDSKASKKSSKGKSKK